MDGWLDTTNYEEVPYYISLK